MIRLALYQDLDRIDEIALLSIKDMAISHIPQWNEAYPRKEHFKKDVEQNALFVYELDKQIVGAMVLLPEQDPPYETITGWLTPHGASLVIHRVVVDPTVRNKGVAQALLDYAIIKGKLENYQSIKIDTHNENYKMRRFLEKNHFQYIGYLTVINREAYERLLEETDENITNRMENR